jgi:magnesium transporter
LWTDIQKPTNEKMTLLAKNYNFHELNVEDCLSKIHIPKVDRYEDHVFIILHFPTTAEKEKTLSRFSQLSILAGRDYLVTLHQGDLKPLDDISQLCNRSDKQRAFQICLIWRIGLSFLALAESIPPSTRIWFISS